MKKVVNLNVCASEVENDHVRLIKMLWTDYKIVSIAHQACAKLKFKILEMGKIMQLYFSFKLS